MSDHLTPEIVRWEVPSDGWLKVEVLVQPLAMRQAFYWCSYSNDYTRNKPTWAWRAWSMAGKPSVDVKPEAARILTRLVAEHETLRHLMEHFQMPAEGEDR